MSNGLKLKKLVDCTQVIHTPTGGQETVILETRWRTNAKNVMDRLAASGVDWTKPHSAENHTVMRLAIKNATSDGNVTPQEL